MRGQYLLAHTPNKKGEPHYLDKHLYYVSMKAKDFADLFGAGSFAQLVGWFHDLGKCNPEFQTYLKAKYEGRPHKKVSHAIWGAAVIYKFFVHGFQDTEGWKELAIPVYGHHVGLPDVGELINVLSEFLVRKPEAFAIVKGFLKDHGVFLPPLRLHAPAEQKQAIRREFFIRMIFSALVDADYLDTEAHFG